MANELSIDPKLLDQVFSVSGEKTRKAAVTKALKEFIARREQASILDLVGKVEWDETYDYKADRAARDRKHGTM